jgi:serine/threonine protein kinase/tetratricopeptide (TPR) repeat protein
MSGSLLNGRYRLQEQLGEGGAGVVFKAEDIQLKRTIAIKLLMAEGQMTDDKLQRFQGEARSVARLNHPNIITLYDYAEEQGRPYLVIEYIPGEDLWELDNRYAPELMPLEESLPIVDGILAALEYSHAHHVVHRDLKPENVMITPDKVVKVMDFGLARIEGQSRLTEDGLVAGTAAYLAPELAMGELGDHRVDLYALGVMMYELFTGRRPFSGDDPLTVISQHIHASVVPPQHYNPAMPNELQRIVLKLLSKKPGERYNSATEVRRDLAAVMYRVQAAEKKGPAASQQQAATAAESPTDPQALLKRISRGKMVGREPELAQLKERWDLVRLGEYSAEPLLLISGEGGIGKTRLLREFRVFTGLRDGYILFGVANERESGRPYALIASVLSDYIAEQSPEMLRSQMPASIAGEVVKLVPRLADKVGPIQPNPPLEPLAERARLLDQISKFLLNISNERPTLLMLDDLQFADPGSLDLLGMLLRQAVGTSLLITGAYRDVALSYSNPTSRLITSLEAANLVFGIALRRLPEAEVKQLLEALLGNSVSKKFVKSIYKATEGNPYFIEELIKSLAVDGQIRLQDGRWAQQNTSLVPIPGSIKAVLGKRLDYFKSQSLELLQLAATIGRNFALSLLEEASPYGDDVNQKGVEEALGAQLIEVVDIVDRPTRSASVEIDVLYQFQHALIRETLYEELRSLRRRQLHRRVAAAIEKLASPEPISNPAELAHHYIAGAEDHKAVPYLRQAGESAFQFYGNEEAVEHFSQACEILEDIAVDLAADERQANLLERFELLSRQRNIFDLMSDRERELVTLEALLKLADTLSDQERWVQVMSRLSTYYWHVGQLDQAEKTARQALQVAQNNDNKQGKQYALERIARVLWTRRDSKSMEYAVQSLELAQQSGDRAREGRLIELIGHIYASTLRDVERAAINFDIALGICREIKNPYEEAWTLWGIGGLNMLVGDYTAALARYIEAQKISEGIGAMLQVGWDLYRMGDVWYSLGDFEQALKLYQQAHAIFDRSNHPRGTIYACISLGLVQTLNGKLDEATTTLEQARQQSEERNDLRLMFRAYEALAAYYLHCGGEDNITKVVRLGNRIIKLATEVQDFEHAILGYYLRAVAFFELRRPQEAIESSKRAVARLERFDYLESPQYTPAEIYYLHSSVAAAMGQLDSARSSLDRAYQETVRRAELIDDEQLRRRFLELPVNHKIVAAGGRLSSKAPN